MIQFILLLNLLLNRGRYDVAWHMATQYKLLAKIFFILQLFVAWIIVVVSTLYASWDGRNAEYGSADDEVNPWWVVSDSLMIEALGQTVFVLTIVATFLISFESYINAKARRPLDLTQIPASIKLGKACRYPAAHARSFLLFIGCACIKRLHLTCVCPGTLATAEVMRRQTEIDHVGVSHARHTV